MMTPEAVNDQLGNYNRTKWDESTAAAFQVRTVPWLGDVFDELGHPPPNQDVTSAGTLELDGDPGNQFNECQSGGEGFSSCRVAGGGHSFGCIRSLLLRSCQ